MLVYPAARRRKTPSRHAMDTAVTPVALPFRLGTRTVRCCVGMASQGCAWVRPGRSHAYPAYRRAAAFPDSALKAVTTLANHSVLWFMIAAVLASRHGVTRRAAVRGVLAIGGASFTNVLGKPLLPRRRPAADALPAWRTLSNPPTSSSFPSGHAASAAAFCTAVTLESPRAGTAVVPLAATIAHSRVHAGVNWPSDVVGGVIIGTVVALGTLRWWPHRPLTPAKARPHARTTTLPAGESLVVVTNPRSGVPPVDPTDEINELLPAARTTAMAGDVARKLETAIDGSIHAVGVAGGDGSVAAVAAVAVNRGLPLAVLPTGTLNHFARRPAQDSGLLDIRYIRAGVPFSRTRFTLAALTGTLNRSRVYVQRESPELRVRVHGPPVALATDGEVFLHGNAFEFAIGPTRLVVYRP